MDTSAQSLRRVGNCRPRTRLLKHPTPNLILPTIDYVDKYQKQHQLRAADVSELLLVGRLRLTSLRNNNRKNNSNARDTSPNASSVEDGGGGGSNGGGGGGGGGSSAGSNVGTTIQVNSSHRPKNPVGTPNNTSPSFSSSTVNNSISYLYTNPLLKPPAPLPASGRLLGDSYRQERLHNYSLRARPTARTLPNHLHLVRNLTVISANTPGKPIREPKIDTRPVVEPVALDQITLSCYICGQSLPAAQLLQHEQLCQQETRKRIPPDERKITLRTDTGTFSETEFIADQAAIQDEEWAQLQEQLKKCESCSRTFFEHRLAKHQMTCKGATSKGKSNAPVRQTRRRR